MAFTFNNWIYVDLLLRKRHLRNAPHPCVALINRCTCFDVVHVFWFTITFHALT